MRQRVGGLAHWVCRQTKRARVNRYDTNMSRAHDHADYQRNRPVVLREQPTCTVCNRQPSTQVDHIIPVDAGGGHELENLRGICFKCNNTLGHRYVTQRNEMRQTIRAEAMRQNGIRETHKPFFTEKKLFTPTQLRIISDDPNQPELADRKSVV